MDQRLLTIGLTLILGAGVMSLGALSGCQTGQPGVRNVAGSVQTTFAASPLEVTDAARQAVEDMRLILVQHQATELDSRVVASTARGDNIRIDIRQGADGGSEVSIRVGAFGDEGTSLTVMNRIREKLNEQPEN